MDSRTILAFVLMILIYFWFFKPPEQVPVKPQEQAARTEEVEEVDKSDLVVEGVREKKGDGALRTKRYSLRNQLLEVEIDGAGSVRNVEFLKYYKTSQEKERVRYSFEKEPFNQADIIALDNFSPWKLIKSTSSELYFTASNKQLNVSRIIRLEPNSYIVSVKDEVSNKTSKSAKVRLAVNLYQEVKKDAKQPGFFTQMFSPQADIHSAAVMTEGAVEREIAKSFDGVIELTELVSWAGFDHKYFFFGLVPKNASLRKISISKESEDLISEKAVLAMKQIGAGKQTDYSYQYYLGPKEIPELKKADELLGGVVDYGDWIGPISRLLLNILHFFYGIIPNYGLAIILLTLLVKVVLFPLSFKSAVSMRKLQVVQPKMQEIREKFKGNNQRMQQELMALYRNEKVNPVGGCLPMLLQMPVFFALYRLFFASIELRHAPFIGWIQDLSSHDPFFVTPVLMTVLMWGQQKLTPMPTAGGDESEAVKMQKAMMKWMPIIFGFIMLFLPSGLTLYFLINALLSVIQQVYLNKHLNIRFPLPNKVAASGKA